MMDVDQSKTKNDKNSIGNQLNALRKQKKKNEFPPLNRPIILVCNEGYAKSLYPLKDLCLKIRVPQVGQFRLTERICEILRAEEIRDIDNQLIQSVIQQCGGDARSCLNRIQMLFQQGKRDVSSDLDARKAFQTNVLKMQTKDLYMGIYEVAQDVLHEPVDGRLSSVQKLKALKNTVGALGSDTTLLNDALFENYSTSAKYFDMNFDKTADFLDLIS